MSLSNADKQRRYRERRKNREFSEKYLKGRAIATCAEFIAAKVREFLDAKPYIDSIEFEDETIQGLLLAMGGGLEDVHTVDDLMRGWPHTINRYIR